MKLWAAYAVNNSDDSRVPANLIGYFSGERNLVWDWLCEARKFPGELRPITIKEITETEVAELRDAKSLHDQAEKRLEAAIEGAK